MKITIGYLYYDLLNLYGDSGNVKALIYHLKEQGVKVDVKYISLGDKIDYSKYDLLYIGSGTEDNLNVAINHLKEDKKNLEKYIIDDNKFVLATGNSIEIFGKKIISDIEIKCLNIFSYITKYGNRVVKDVKDNISLINEEIIGFENHYGTNNLDELIIKRYNFYGTYIIGPLLVRNPAFCSYLVKELILSKDKKFKFKEENYILDNEAYKKKIEIEK